MKTRTCIIFGICFLVCLVSLCIPAWIAGKYRDLLLALPNNISSPKINVADIEEFCKSDFLLTYEMPYPERINTSHAAFPVTLIGTNSSYPQLLKYLVVEGSFFSSQAWAGKLRHAVLNESAAFTLFGSISVTGNFFRIRNDTWIVTGVIRDEKEDNRIYVPSSVRGGAAEAFAMMTSSAYDETLMKNSLRSLRIRDENFEFINFNTRIRLLWDRIIVLLLGFFGLLLLVFLKPLFNIFRKNWKILKAEHEKSYAREILGNNRRLIFNNILPLSGLIVFPLISLFLFNSIAAICLPWQDISSLGRMDMIYFNSHLEHIRVLQLVSGIIFIVSIVAAVILILTIYKRNSTLK